jgi:hypothetical protein
MQINIKKIPGSGSEFGEFGSETMSPLYYLLDEPVETGEHVKNGREVPVDVLMLVQTVELWLHQQDVLRETELQQEVVVHLFKRRDRAVNCSRVIKESDCQCQCSNSPGVNPAFSDTVESKGH